MDVSDRPEVPKPRRPIQGLVVEPLDGCRRSSIAGFPRPELLMVLPASVAEPLWMCYHGHALLSVDKVSTSPVPFLLVVEGPVQPPERHGGMSHCPTR